MLVGWQVVRVVCLVYKIVHLPFYMFGTGPLKSQLCSFHQVLCPSICFLCHNVMSNFHEVYPG